MPGVAAPRPLGQGRVISGRLHAIVVTSEYAGTRAGERTALECLTGAKCGMDRLRMLGRRQVAQRGIAPAVTPIVRIPPNQGQANWVAKQMLDIGVYGIIWPHVDTVEDAYNAVAAMRYPRAEGRPLREPFGRRSDAPRRAVTYWGIMAPSSRSYAILNKGRTAVGRS